MQIDVTFDQSVGSLPSGFVSAISYVVGVYDSLFTANVTINIDVGYGEINGTLLSASDLGASAQDLYEANYSSVVTALQGQGAPGSSSLPPSAPTGNPGTLVIDTAEAKALALIPPAAAVVDGYVGFSSTANLSYSPTATPAAGQYYFVGIVEHEISEDLGRISVLDLGGGYSVMDLFRYSGSGTRQFTVNSPSYFSINNGVTNLDNWNNFQTGNPGGDLGDWALSAGNDAYDYAATPGVINAVSATDITLMNALGWSSTGSATLPGATAPLAAGTTADMVLSNGSGNYEIYDIGANSILLGEALGQVNSDYKFVGLGDFSGGDTSDMMLRSASTGNFVVYDISNNAITSATLLGAVGSNWLLAGFGSFNGASATSDMMLRDSASGTFELYDIAGNAIVGASTIGAVGLDWAVAGFGDFNGDGTTDMMLRNTNSGAFEAYDIVGGQLAGAAAVGAVGLDWQVAGFFNSGNTTDMMLRNANTGVFELYGIQNNAVAGAAAIGAVGLDWTVSGFGPFDGAGSSDMVLRNTNSGAFEVYDIVNGQLAGAASLGAVGLDWHLGGFAAASAASASSTTLQNAQLVQAASGLAPPPAASTAGVSPALEQATLQQPLSVAAAH